MTTNYQTSTSHYPRWKKRLLLCPRINAFDAYETFLYISISLETTDTSEFFSVYTLVDSKAIGVFINQSFVEKYSFNTHKLSRPVLVYNVDTIQNEAG